MKTDYKAFIDDLFPIDGTVYDYQAIQNTLWQMFGEEPTNEEIDEVFNYINSKQDDL